MYLIFLLTINSLLNKINSNEISRIKFNKMNETFFEENKINIKGLLKYLSQTKILKTKLNIFLSFDILRNFIYFSKSLALKNFLKDKINDILLELIKRIKENLINKTSDKKQVCIWLENSFKIDIDYKNIIDNNFHFIFNFELKYAENLLIDELKTKNFSENGLEIDIFTFSQMVLFFEEFFKPKNYKQTFKDFYDFLFMASFTSKYTLNESINFDKKNSLRVNLISYNNKKPKELNKW